jgi:hypothetical protein
MVPFVDSGLAQGESAAATPGTRADTILCLNRINPGSRAGLIGLLDTFQ